MSTEVRGSSPSLSIREKTLKKRRVTKEHSSNFHAGYVHVNEEYLHKTGIRGRKKYVLYAVVGIMAVIAVVNIFITWTIMGALAINKDGMAFLEFIRHSRLIRFLGRTDIDEFIPLQNTVFSLPEKDMNISGVLGQKVYLREMATNTNMTVSLHGVTLDNVKEFTVTDPDTGKAVFTSDFRKFRFPDKTKSVKTDQATAQRIVGPPGKELRLESAEEVVLRGSEGAHVDAKSFVASAQENVDIRTSQTLTVDAAEDLYLDQVQTMTVATGQETDTQTEAYRLCVCMPHGKVFAVPAPYKCDQANENVNPCLN